MSYRCEVCTVHVAHNTPLMRHVTYKRVGVNQQLQIAKETPVCASCLEKLSKFGNNKPSIKVVPKFKYKDISPTQRTKLASNTKIQVGVQTWNGTSALATKKSRKFSN